MAPDERRRLTLDDNYSRDTLDQKQYGYSVWFNSGSLRTSRATQQHRDQLRSEVTPTDFQAQINSSRIQNNIIGLNEVGRHRRQTFEFDAAYADGQAQSERRGQQLDMDVGYGPSGSTSTAGAPTAPTSASPASAPTACSTRPASGPGNDQSRFINNGIIGSHVLPILSNQNTDTVKQFKRDGDLEGRRTILQINYGSELRHR